MPASPPEKVDTSIPPHATGNAATLVGKHQNEQDLTLYAGWFCPFVQRTWIVLEELQIPYQYVEINPYQKSVEFLALNPRGLVPALGINVSDGGEGEGKGEEKKKEKKKKKQKVLYESTILNEYLDTQYNSSRLFSTSSNYEKFRQKLWIDHIGSKIIPAFYRLLQHTPDTTAEYTIQSARQNLRDAIKSWILEADPKGPFWAGENLGMVDISLAPWNERFWLIQVYKEGGMGLPFYGNLGSCVPKEEKKKKEEEEEEEEEWVKRWLKWSKAISERKSVRDTLSEREMYLKSYKRYAENTTMSEVAKATRRNGKLP